MSTHTPGQWRVSDIGAGFEVDSEDGRCVAQAQQVKAARSNGKHHDERSANARLIAAAPDMLEALEDARMFIRNGVEFGFIRMPDSDTHDPAHKTILHIEAAIAKAKG